LTDTRTSPVALEGVPPCEISVDTEGNWYFEGNEITRTDILRTLLESVIVMEENTYGLEWEGKFCLLDTEDTPFVVSRVDRKVDASGEVILLTFKHLPGEEALDPSTLHANRENVLYCRIREGRFTARFLRPAYYQLAERIEEEAGEEKFYLELNGIRHYIDMPDPLAD